LAYELEKIKLYKDPKYGLPIDFNTTTNYFNNDLFYGVYQNRWTCLKAKFDDNEYIGVYCTGYSNSRTFDPNFNLPDYNSDLPYL
jgi:hypothetical protein